ncbi:DNA-3-methyladenine glycosylase I [Marinibaculum pumilum]|uniref:DNA-3-methyladenine glycosylase I n=1 Tax=Marinibaculum pumilum TaxID=1766165 RepID=A0ABV7KZR7_9PROT
MAVGEPAAGPVATEGRARTHADGVCRCPWPGETPDYVAYHDTEWGVAERDHRALFEKLILDGFQAGLSWLTILRKRENFRHAFDGFRPELIARYDAAKVAALMADAGIVRNRAKIEGTIRNAQGWLAIMESEPGGFSEMIWAATDGRVRHNSWRSIVEVPAETAESRALSKRLKSHGFTFVGPTIVYAFMQAVGVVNDHLTDCYRHRELGGG